MFDGSGFTCSMVARVEAFQPCDRPALKITKEPAPSGGGKAGAWAAGIILSLAAIFGFYIAFRRRHAILGRFDDCMINMRRTRVLGEDDEVRRAPYGGTFDNPGRGDGIWGDDFKSTKELERRSGKYTVNVIT